MRTRLRMLISRQADRKSLAKKPLVPVTVLNFNLAHKHADRASSSAYNILQYSSSNVYNILLTNTSTDIHKVPQCSTVAHLCSSTACNILIINQTKPTIQNIHLQSKYETNGKFGWTKALTTSVKSLFKIGQGIWSGRTSQVWKPIFGQKMSAGKSLCQTNRVIWPIKSI